MANYTQLIQTINDNIKANGNQEITGPVLNAVLQAIVKGLSKGSLFAGIANTTTNPPAYDGNVFYIAVEPGAYSNFGVIVPHGGIGIIHNTSSDWEVTLINTYYEIDVDTLMQDSPSSDDIDEAIGSLADLRRAITVGVPILGKSASGGNSTVAIAQVKQLSDTEVRVVMLNTGTVDGSNELVPIIKKITNSAGRLSLSTEAPTSFIGPLSSLNTNDKGSVVDAINEVNTDLKSAVEPYVVDLTSLLAAQDSESISTAIGGIDNLNGTVQKNQVIFGTLANGTVAVGIRVLGNKTTLTYFVDSVVGLTVNEVIITNTSGTLTKTANTHAVITENMVIDSLDSDEATLPLSAAQGKVLATDKQGKTDKSLQTTDKTVAGAINEVNQAVKTKQDKLKPGTGVEITSDNTVNVTLDTTVFKVVASLPESPAAGDENKIHLVPAESTEEGNIYTEYVFVNGKWEEFGTYKSEVDLAQYLKSTEAEATYQKITDNTLATTAKTIVGAINEVHTDLESAVQPYVVDLTSLLAAQDSESISTAIGGIDNLNGTVQKNQVIFGTLANGTVAVGIRVLGNKTTLTYFVDSVVGLTVNEVIITNTSGTLTKTANTHAVITENMVIDSLDSDEATLPLSAAQGKALNEKIQNSASTAALHKIYETYGAVYNDDTGYWEYGDLKDMTEEDCFLAAFYALEQIQGDNQVSFILDRYKNLSARTYFTKITPKGAQNDTNLVLNACFARNSKLEYLKLSNTPASSFLYIKNMENAFMDCRKLRKIEDILTIRIVNNNYIKRAFMGCSALKDVKIRFVTGANVDISFEDSPLLSYESIKYLVDNAGNTKAITVTVHPTTYSYLRGTAQPTEEVGGTTEEWQALVTTAQGKQISFA